MTSENPHDVGPLKLIRRTTVPNASLGKVHRLLPKLGPVTRITYRHFLMIHRNFEAGHGYVYRCLNKQIAVPYLVLQALNIELSRARSKVSVSNPSLVKGKYVFWRDVVNGAENEHPIGSALLEVIREHRLPKDVLLSLIDAKVRKRTTVHSSISVD